MTRKDFELIARVIREAREYEPRADADTLNDVAARFADELAGTNPNFNRTRFLAACGVEEA